MVKRMFATTYTRVLVFLTGCVITPAFGETLPSPSAPISPQATQAEPSPLPSATPAPPYETAVGTQSGFTPHYHLLNFGSYLTFYDQPSGSGNSNSALLTWSPAFYYSENLTFISDLGGTVLNTANYSFLALYLNLRGSYRLSDAFALDLGMGTQDWTAGAGGFLFMTGLGLKYEFSTAVFHLIKDVRAALNYVAYPGSPTYQFLIGVEWDLGAGQ